MTRRNVLISAAIVVALVVSVGGIYRDQIAQYFFRPTQSTVPTGVIRDDGQSIDVVATDLQTPWGIAFMPSGDMLVTQRPGMLTRIDNQDKQSYDVAGVTETSEGGLLGIALHPSFERNQFIYLYSTYRGAGNQLLNRVERYVYRDDTLSRDRVIIDQIPGSSIHDGGALAFGPDDGKLYITTGDAGNDASAQDTASLSGKILRLNDDGTIPADNPFDNPIYSYGHRNPQGITWDDRGRMWSTEHGPSGGQQSGRDELNLIESGQNYGWPTITGDQEQQGMRSPVAQSGADDTWAPGALVFIDGSLYFTGLRGQTLYQATIQSSPQPTVSIKRYLSNDYGRLRGAAVHDGALYISTSNTDGRGSPNADDDKIVRIDPAIFAN